MITKFTLISVAVSIVILSVFLTILYAKHRKRLAKELEEKLAFFQEQIRIFFAEYFEIRKQYVSESLEFDFISKWQNLYSDISKFHISQKHSAFEEITHFKKTYANLHDEFETANNQFIQNESAKYDSLFSDIDGKSLDEQQRTAVITDEGRVLVLAGAGSGKTLTIAAKVKYLVAVKNVKPSEILLISFTRKSAEEMTERIQEKLKIPAEATTFHKLGLGIISNADGKRADVADENALKEFVHDFFENEVVNHADLVKALTEYFAYFLEIPRKSVFA